MRKEISLTKTLNADENTIIANTFSKISRLQFALSEDTLDYGRVKEAMILLQQMFDIVNDSLPNTNKYYKKLEVLIASLNLDPHSMNEQKNNNLTVMGNFNKDLRNFAK